MNVQWIPGIGEIEELKVSCSRVHLHQQIDGSVTCYQTLISNHECDTALSMIGVCREVASPMKTEWVVL